MRLATSTFYPEGGALRRLSHTRKDILMQVGTEGLHQPDRGCAFPFSQGRWSNSSRTEQEAAELMSPQSLHSLIIIYSK